MKSTSINKLVDYISSVLVSMDVFKKSVIHVKLVVIMN